MVEIAKAVGADAKIVIMDEPTASLMDDEVDRLFEVIAMLRRQGAGIVYISHRLEEVFAVSDRITVLRDGETVATRDDRGDRSRGADSGDGRTDAERGLSEAAGRAGRRRARVAPPLQPRARHPRRVVAVSGAVRCSALPVSSDRDGPSWPKRCSAWRRRTAARFCFDGAPVRIESPSQAIRLGIGYVPEDRRQHGVVLEMPIAVECHAWPVCRRFVAGV